MLIRKWRSSATTWGLVVYFDPWNYFRKTSHLLPFQVKMPKVKLLDSSKAQLYARYTQQTAYN